MKLTISYGSTPVHSTELEAQPDREYESRLDAQRCTLEFGQKSNRKLDSGKEPIEDGPLFGGPRQGGLFE